MENKIYRLIIYMTSAWIQHVKDTQTKHGCSYKDAMKLASQTYQKQSGAGLKSVVRKVKNTTKKVRKGVRQASKQIDKHQDFINFINEDAGKSISKANAKFKEADDKLGGKMDMRKVVRKAKNTVKKVKRVSKKMAPLVAMAGHPEAGLMLEAVGSGNKYIDAIGSGHCSTGGSFSVPKSGSGSYQHTNSTILNPQHPGFKPLKPKSKARQQKEN